MNLRSGLALCESGCVLAKYCTLNESQGVVLQREHIRMDIYYNNILYGSRTWYFSSGEVHMLTLLNGRVLSKILGP